MYQAYLFYLSTNVKNEEQPKNILKEDISLTFLPISGIVDSPGELRWSFSVGFVDRRIRNTTGR